jgi:hypothetical protein
MAGIRKFSALISRWSISVHLVFFTVLMDSVFCIHWSSIEKLLMHPGCKSPSYSPAEEANNIGSISCCNCGVSKWQNAEAMCGCESGMQLEVKPLMTSHYSATSSWLTNVAPKWLDNGLWSSLTWITAFLLPPVPNISLLFRWTTPPLVWS